MVAILTFLAFSSNSVVAWPNEDFRSKTTEPGVEKVPEWVSDAVFYQIFPERFRNGDRTNDPTRSSLEFPDIIPENWTVTPWTTQWYRRSDWELKMGPDFYENGVFHRRFGGDLQGVISKLDYLSELGINAIYFNPVFYARSLHKYDGNSFHHIDPHFGPDPTGDFAAMAQETDQPSTWNWTAADKLFLDLIKRAHKRNIRVIIDGVFNHTGRDFFAFQDIVKNQERSPYAHWYIIEKYDDLDTEENEFQYKGWWGVDTLPEFANNADDNDLHPSPKKYVMQATARWMDPNQDGDPSDGIDGWRLDVANEVPDKFWQDWNGLVRKLNPNAYTTAEIWDNAASYLEECGFSATMNYHGFAFPVKGFLIDGRLSATRFGEMIENRMNEHKQDVRFALQNLIDSHDTDRLASMIVNSRYDREYLNRERFDFDVGERVSPRSFHDYDVSAPKSHDRRLQKLVALFQFTFVGAPMIYYGTEAGMDGADDPDDRMPMVWDDLEYEQRSLGPQGKLPSTKKIVFDKELFRFYQELITLRNKNDVLRRGDYELLRCDDARKLFVFGRMNKNSRMMVAINRGSEPVTLNPENLPWLKNPDQWSMVFSTADIDKSSTGTSVSGNVLPKFRLDSQSGKVWRVSQ